MTLAVSGTLNTNTQQVKKCSAFSGRVLDLRLRGCMFKQNISRCYVVLEQDALSSGKYWLTRPDMTQKMLTER